MTDPAALLLLTTAGCKCGDGLVRGFGDRFDFALIGDIPYSPAAVTKHPSCPGDQ